MRKSKPQKRSAVYKGLMISSIVLVFLIPIDVLFFDSSMKLLIYFALGTMLFFAIFLLFDPRPAHVVMAQRKQKAKETRPAKKTSSGGGASSSGQDVEDPDDLPGRELLHCPNCAHVFAVATPADTKGWRRKVVFTCPECGIQGILPPKNATPVEKVVPGGELRAKKFRCGNCKNIWGVGVIGHRVKKRVDFHACPSCGSEKYVKPM